MPGLRRGSRRLARRGQPAARPAVRPTGPRVVARSYDRTALPANRVRSATNWLFTAAGSRPAVHLGPGARPGGAAGHRRPRTGPPVPLRSSPCVR